MYDATITIEDWSEQQTSLFIFLVNERENVGLLNVAMTENAEIKLKFTEDYLPEFYKMLNSKTKKFTCNLEFLKV